MYKGFNLEIDFKNSHFYNIGLQNLESLKTKISNTLDSFIGVDGTIDGTALQQNWFRDIDTHIFISHSHKDSKTAITLAGYLYDKFRIKCFVDSIIWGYSVDLLKLIDDKYCKNKLTNSYNYNKRNSSTAHVHMMLSSALTMMIDRSECLIFINTPNSITTDLINDATYSPWLYFELNIFKTIQKKEPVRVKNGPQNKVFSSLNEDLRIKYLMNLSNLNSIKESDILEVSSISSDAISFLDNLYNI